MKTTKEKIAVMQAFEDGKKIEFRPRHVVNWPWKDTQASPEWDWESCDYRVKKEPAVVYINEYSTGFAGSVFTDPQKARNAASSTAIRVAVKFVEAPSQ